ncbi:aristolochene synthase [Colletotrichum sp. SAR 10_98]|nr:aristolochene synthase [Colletotrichum sp. SAR 10_98]
MREKDRRLADQVLEPTFIFMRAKTEKIRTEITEIGRYLQYRSETWARPAMEQDAEHNKKQLKPFRFTPFPFHHLAWNEDSIEQRLAWAKQAVDEGYDINAVYKPSMDPPYPKDTVSTPLMEILDYAIN